MEQSRVTDEEKIHNSTLHMQTVLDTQQQLLQTLTSRLSKSEQQHLGIYHVGLINC